MTTRTQRQNLFGTAAQIAAYTGVAREVIYDTTNKQLVLTDGATLGGAAVIPNKAYVDAQVAAVTAGLGNNLILWATCI